MLVGKGNGKHKGSSVPMAGVERVGFTANQCPLLLITEPPPAPKSPKLTFEATGTPGALR